MGLSKDEQVALCTGCRLRDCYGLHHAGCRLRQALASAAWQVQGLTPPPSWRLRRRRRRWRGQLDWRVLALRGRRPQLVSEARQLDRRLLVWFVGRGRPDRTRALSVAVHKARLL